MEPTVVWWEQEQRQSEVSDSVLHERSMTESRNKSGPNAMQVFGMLKQATWNATKSLTFQMLATCLCISLIHLLNCYPHSWNWRWDSGFTYKSLNFSGPCRFITFQCQLQQSGNWDSKPQTGNLGTRLGWCDILFSTHPTIMSNVRRRKSRRKARINTTQSAKKLKKKYQPKVQFEL